MYRRCAYAATRPGICVYPMHTVDRMRRSKLQSRDPSVVLLTVSNCSLILLTIVSSFAHPAVVNGSGLSNSSARCEGVRIIRIAVRASGCHERYSANPEPCHETDSPM